MIGRSFNLNIVETDVFFVFVCCFFSLAGFSLRTIQKCTAFLSIHTFPTRRRNIGFSMPSKLVSRSWHSHQFGWRFPSQSNSHRYICPCSFLSISLIDLLCCSAVREEKSRLGSPLDQRR